MRALRVVGLTLGFIVGLTARADAHPLHTTMTEITLDPTGQSLHIVVRTFADDYTKAAGAAAGRAGPAAVNGPESWAYLQRAFAVFDGGRPVPLRSCGVKQTGNLLWICVDASVSGSLSAMKVRSAILCELYDDQVNIVRSLVRGAARSILFVKGDAPKGVAA